MRKINSQENISQDSEPSKKSSKSSKVKTKEKVVLGGEAKMKK